VSSWCVPSWLQFQQQLQRLRDRVPVSVGELDVDAGLSPGQPLLAACPRFSRKWRLSTVSTLRHLLLESQVLILPKPQLPQLSIAFHLAELLLRFQQPSGGPAGDVAHRAQARLDEVGSRKTPLQPRPRAQPGPVLPRYDTFPTEAEKVLNVVIPSGARNPSLSSEEFRCSPSAPFLLIDETTWLC